MHAAIRRTRTRRSFSVRARRCAPGLDSKRGTPKRSDVARMGERGTESPILFDCNELQPTTTLCNARKKEDLRMRRSLVITLATCLFAVGTPGFAQRAETFTARLDWVPIGGTERNDVAGEGAVSA